MERRRRAWASGVRCAVCGGGGEAGYALLSEEGRRWQRRQGEGQQHGHNKRYVHADAQSKD